LTLAFLGGSVSTFEAERTRPQNRKRVFVASKGVPRSRHIVDTQSPSRVGRERD
jgi:hypothetical protein